MSIFSVGISHKNTPIEIREQFYLKPVEQELLLSNFKSNPSIVEAFVLSTCNRTEIYVNLLDGSSQDFDEMVVQSLFEIKKIQRTDSLMRYFYKFEQRGAIEHILRVVGGLESLVLGEKQILGQVRTAIELSRKKGMLGKEFNILANTMARTGKKSQTETNIGFGGVSVSWAAIRTASEVLGSLEGKKVLILGAGKMGKLALSQLKSKGISELYVVNRTYEKAVELAKEFNGIPVAFCNLKEALEKVDCCIASSGCPHYLIEKEMIRQVMGNRKDRKLVLIDISMPRNINPQVKEQKNVMLVSIDELDKIVGKNLEKRRLAVSDVEGIVFQKINEYYDKLDRARRAEQVRLDNALQLVNY